MYIRVGFNMFFKCNTYPILSVNDFLLKDIRSFRVWWQQSWKVKHFFHITHFWVKVGLMALGKSSFRFRFRPIIQFLPMWSMDDKAEGEPKTVLAKYYRFYTSFSNAGMTCLRAYSHQAKVIVKVKKIKRTS